MRGCLIPAAMGLALAAGPAPATLSSDAPTHPPARTFSNVNPAILICMQDRSRKKYGTIYRPDANNPNIGTSETHYYGVTLLSFVFDPAGATITYTILRKPGLASNGQVWDGIGKEIKACS
jgi:hypothetical protein